MNGLDMSTSTELKNAKNDDAAFHAIVDRRRKARMGTIDAMPKDLRDLVNEYGFTVVNTCLTLGLKKPSHIRHLVETVLNEFSPTRGSYSAQGRRGDGDGIDAGPMKRNVQP